MGFIEETGAAQYLRDARITTIYEGTTGIQANDLIGRKLGRDGGAAMRALIVDMQVTIEQLNDSANADCKVVGKTLEDSVHGLRSATRWALDAAAQNAAEPLAGAVPYLMMFGTVCGGWMLGQSALVAEARAALSSIEGVTLYGPEDSAGIVSFNVDGVHAHDTATILDDAGVAVRAGHHCAQPLMEWLGVPATARASFAAHSDSSDIAALVRGIEQVKRIFSA
jgi:hypothetical protein